MTDTYYIVIFENDFVPLVTVDSVTPSKGSTFDNDSHFKIENFSVPLPLKKLSRNHNGLSRTFITNFGNSHLPAYEAIVKEHNEKVGRVELVIDYNNAYYGEGRKLDGHSSIHNLGHNNVNIYDRWKFFVKELGLSEFSSAEEYPKTKPYGNGMGKGVLVTNFSNSQASLYSEAVGVYNKTVDSNQKLWISHVAYDCYGKVVKNYMSLRRNSGICPDLSDFWKIYEGLKKVVFI